MAKMCRDSNGNTIKCPTAFDVGDDYVETGFKPSGHGQPGMDFPTTYPYRIATLSQVKDAVKWINRNFPHKNGVRAAAVSDVWSKTPAVLRYYRPLKKLAAQFGMSGMGCGCAAPTSLSGLGVEPTPQLDTADKITKTANAIFGIVNSAAKNYFTIKAMNKMKDGMPLTMDQAVNNQESWLDRNKSFVIGGIVVAGIAAFLFFKKR